MGSYKRGPSQHGYRSLLHFPVRRIITTCYPLPSFSATIILIFPIGGGEGGLRYKEGADTPKARAEERARTSTFFIRKTIVIYTYSVFFFPIHLLTIHHCDKKKFRYNKCRNIIEWNEKNKNKIDAGDDDRPTIIADYHRKEALESPSRLCVCICMWVFPPSFLNIYLFIFARVLYDSDTILILKITKYCGLQIYGQGLCGQNILEWKRKVLKGGYCKGFN